MNATSALSSTLAGAAADGSAAGKASQASEMGDRFLKLLVTQLKNQDPLNPMDNAQLTSQMAQVNTVAGIEKLNDSMQSLGTRFVQAQALQGAALIGRRAWIEGDRLTADQGVARGGFELSLPAEKVQVEVLSPSGRVLDTLQLGSHDEGRGSFEWRLPGNVAPEGLRFRVVAGNGSQSVGATPISIDTVSSVATTPSGLSLGLARLGAVDFSKVRVVS